MNKLLNKNEAVEAVINELKLDLYDTRVLCSILSGGYYEIVLCSRMMQYDCFVDSQSGEVCGIDSRPSVVNYPGEYEYLPLSVYPEVA